MSGVYQWIRVLSTFTKRCRNSSGFRWNRAKHVFEVVSRFRFFSGLSKCGIHRGDSFFHFQNLMQDIANAFSCCAWHCSQFANFHSVFRQYKIMDFVCGSRFWATWKTDVGDAEILLAKGKLLYREVNGCHKHNREWAPFARRFCHSKTGIGSLSDTAPFP